MAMAITACSSNSMLCISSVSEKTEDEDDTGSSSDDDTDLDTFQYKSSQFQCCELTHVTSNIQNLANI